MAPGEAIVTNEERAAAIRAEAVDKREMVAALAHDKVAPAMQASNDAVLHETFERAAPSVQPSAEQEASAPEADASPTRDQQPSTQEANASPAGTAQQSQASTTASPSPATNADDFDDEVSAVHEKAQDIDRQTFFKQQAVEPGENPNKTGAMELSAFAARQGDSAEERKKKEEDKRFKDLLKLLDDNIDWLTEQLGKIDKRLGEIAEERRGIDDALGALDELDALRRNGELDPNNPAHAALLQRAGLRPEDADRENLEFVLRARRHELLEDRDRLDQEEDRLRERRREYQDDLDRARKIKERLERGDPSAEREARDFNGQVEERRAMFRAAASTDDELARRVYEDEGLSQSEQDYVLGADDINVFAGEFEFGDDFSLTPSFASTADPLSAEGERLAKNFNEQAAPAEPHGPDHEFQIGVNIAATARPA